MTLTIELSAGAHTNLERQARSEGVSVEVYVQRLLERDLLAESETASPGDQPLREVTEEILRRMASLPRESFSDSAGDGASEHDHYIYGTPKKGR